MGESFIVTCRFAHWKSEIILLNPLSSHTITLLITEFPFQIGENEIWLCELTVNQASIHAHTNRLYEKSFAGNVYMQWMVLTMPWCTSTLSEYSERPKLLAIQIVYQQMRQTYFSYRTPELWKWNVHIERCIDALHANILYYGNKITAEASNIQILNYCTLWHWRLSDKRETYLLNRIGSYHSGNCIL